MYFEGYNKKAVEFLIGITTEQHEFHFMVSEVNIFAICDRSIELNSENKALQNCLAVEFRRCDDSLAKKR